MNVKMITQYFIALSILVILGYDVFAYIQGGSEATVSSIIINEWSRDYPAFTFLMGFTMGHLFWPMSKNKRVT